MHKALLGDRAIFKYIITSQWMYLRLCKQNFAPIIHPSIIYHCVGVQVSDTQIMPCFGKLFQAINNITGGVVSGFNIEY